jgi:hypothetical protein
LDRVRLRPGGRAARVALACVAALLAPTAALGVPVEFWFDGPTFGGSLHIGVSEDAALASGLALYDEALTDPTGLLSVTSQVLDGSSIVWPVPPSFDAPVQATSDWTVEAQVPLDDHVFLIFVTTTDAEYLGVSGLEVDADDGWVLVRSQLQGMDVYFPAVDLGVLPAAGATAQTQIHYLSAIDLKWDPDAFEYLLPQLMVAVTTTTTPVAVAEPGSGALLALGGGLLLLRLRRTA